jgi:hypothetical protein
LTDQQHPARIEPDPDDQAGELLIAGHTTQQKIEGLIAAVSTLDPATCAPEVRGFVATIQMAAGFGIDFFEVLRPDDPADADLLIDRCLILLFQLRGDDLPPFDPSMFGELDAASVGALEQVDEQLPPAHVLGEPDRLREIRP